MHRVKMKTQVLTGRHLTTLKKASDELQIGDSIAVRREVSGKVEIYVATIVEVKRVRETQATPNFERMEVDQEPAHVRESSAGLSNGTTDSESGQSLFYVHYNGMDRRLDEWIERSRIVADESEYAQTLNPINALVAGKTLTRSQRRFHEEFHHLQKSYDDMDATTAKLEREHEERTKVKNVDLIQFGIYEIDAWYFSPFPLSETIDNSKFYFCEFCLWYTSDLKLYNCHCVHQCTKRMPPGVEIYRDKNLAVFEVAGKTQMTYCQSLCLLSKLFLDHKTLYYDVEGFLFYVLCEVDEEGYHVVGHFSKEIGSVNNLACIMVLPPFQRKGYGKLLIQLSYCLSEKEGIIGTPEKPLSDLGKVSYRSYWWWVLLGVLDDRRVDENISVGDLSRLSRIHVDDIIYTFNTLQLLKYWKGDHVIRASRKIVYHCKHLNLFHPPKLLLNWDAVKWTPRIIEKIS